LGAFIGLWAWHVRSRSAKTTQINLQACFPEKTDREIKALARNSMKHWGITLCEIPVVWRKGENSLKWIQSLSGSELVEQAKDSTTGVIFISPHLGNWELMGYWAANQGPITSFYQPPRRFDLDNLLVDARKKTGATLAPTNARGLAQLIKALKKGEYVGILPDMEPDLSGGVFAPFFGVPALTMTLIHKLQQRTGALIILGFAKRVPGGFEVFLSTPEQGIGSESVEEYTTALNCAVEKLVQLAPAQYQWEYKRFKRRPEG